MLMSQSVAMRGQTLRQAAAVQPRASRRAALAVRAAKTADGPKVAIVGVT